MVKRKVSLKRKKQIKYEDIVQEIKFDRDTSLKKLNKIGDKLEKLRPKVSNKYREYIDDLLQQVGAFTEEHERDIELYGSEY